MSPVVLKKIRSTFLVLACVDHNNKAYFYQEENGKKVNRFVVRVDKEACAINRWICQAIEDLEDIKL